MIEDDRESINSIDEANAKLEVSSSASETVTNMVEKIGSIISDNHLDIYEKFMQHEGLKHQLVMTGLLVHKSAQATDGILQKLG